MNYDKLEDEDEISSAEASTSANSNGDENWSSESHPASTDCSDPNEATVVSHHRSTLDLFRRVPTWSKIKRGFHRNWILFVVKPVMVFYGLQFAITGSITTQLWIDRTCLITFGYNETVCSNLTDERWEKAEIEVQKQVADFKVVDSYLGNAAPILMSLYLGPKSDRVGRKLLMYIPFSGHLVSGLVPIAFLYFPQLPPQFLWWTNLYTLCGGFAVLQIAMNGYLADVTNRKNRTTMMALLAGLTILVFPLAEALGGQIFNYLGYYAVYYASIAFTLMGLIYICFIPESVSSSHTQSSHAPSNTNICQKIIGAIYQGNKNMISSVRCVVKPRQGSKRLVVVTLLTITIISTMEFSVSSVGLLFVERQFGWNIVQYTNYYAFAITIFGLRTFVTTPLLCYYLGIHDCMLAITGGLAAICGHITRALATKGWMMYYASGLTIIGGIESTPLKSLLSKCVSSEEYGKVFTLSSVAGSIASLIGATVVPKIYNATIDTFPGTFYFFFAGIQVLVVCVMIGLYFVIIRHERVFGVLGKDQDDQKTMEECTDEDGLVPSSDDKHEDDQPQANHPQVLVGADLPDEVS